MSTTLYRLCIAIVCTSFALGVGCVVEDPEQNQQENADNDNTVANDTEFDCSSTGEVSENITEDTTFSPEDNDCLIVTSTIRVDDGALLTIEPGVVLQFEQETGLSVREGRMSAAGTASDPIIFTGTNEQPGWWMGIQFRNTRSQDNQLEHAIVEYGGGDSFSRSDGPANLVLNSASGDAEVAVDNTVLQHSGSAGLLAEDDTTLYSFEDNTLSNNDIPAIVDTEHLGMLSNSSSFEGNDRDYVHVAGSNLGGGDHTWQALDVPYRIASTIELRGSTHVDIEAGATFEFEDNTGLSAREGTLNIEGAEDDEVLFTATEEQNGWWKGIQYRDTRSHNNQVDHAIIEYAGGDEFSRASGSAGLLLNTASGDPEAGINNTTIRHSGSVGLFVEEDSVLSSFQNNTLTENDDGPARIRPQELGMIDDSSSYDGNGEDYLWVPGGSLNSDDHTWSNIGIPYAVTGEIGIRNNAHVDVDPGAAFAFDEHAGINVREGTFSAVGTDDDTITFEQLDEDLSAYWAGIQYRDTRSVNNRLEHVLIRGGGSEEFGRASGPAGLVFNTASGDPEAALADVEITDYPSNAAVMFEDGSSLSECSGMSGFGADDVSGGGAADFIDACGL